MSFMEQIERSVCYYFPHLRHSSLYRSSNTSISYILFPIIWILFYNFLIILIYRKLKSKGKCYLYVVCRILNGKFFFISVPAYPKDNKEHPSMSIDSAKTNFLNDIEEELERDKRYEKTSVLVIACSSKGET